MKSLNILKVVALAIPLLVMSCHTHTKVVKDQPCVKPMLKHKKIHIPCLWKCVLIDKTHSKATEYLRIIDSDLLLSKSYQIRQLSLETPVFIAFAAIWPLLILLKTRSCYCAICTKTGPLCYAIC